MMTYIVILIQFKTKIYHRSIDSFTIRLQRYLHKFNSVRVRSQLSEAHTFLKSNNSYCRKKQKQTNISYKHKIHNIQRCKIKNKEW